MATAVTPGAKPKEFDCEGYTTSGTHYPTIAAMWQSELAAPENPWYRKSEVFWQHQAPSINGMLGGLDDLHERDIAFSKRYLRRLNPKFGRALDVGAGIGRVTNSLLLPIFQSVDMLEQNEDYLNQSFPEVPSTSGNGDEESGGGYVDRKYVCGMQEYSSRTFQARDGAVWSDLIGRYDVIWVQWCIIYLTDADFVSFFRECRRSLAENGVICVKDNVTGEGFLVDHVDSSVMRSGQYLKHLFRQAGLHLFKSSRQLDFPDTIYPVWTYALRPIAVDLREECHQEADACTRSDEGDLTNPIDGENRNFSDEQQQYGLDREKQIQETE